MNFGGILFNRAFARHITRHIGAPASGTTILEVGTGRGVCSLTLRKMGYRCISVDSSSVAARLAGAQGLDVVLADGRRLPFRSNAFDAVFTQGLLEHLEVHDQTAILEESHRVAPKAIHSVPAKYGVMDIGERLFKLCGKEWPYPDEKKYESRGFAKLLETTFNKVRINQRNADSSPKKRKTPNIHNAP